SVTAPSVRHDRKVMMAMTKIMELLATLPCGTIEVGRRRGGASAGLTWGRASSVMDFQPSARQHHAARIDLVHQGQVVRGDHHGGAEPVELEEKPQQAARQRRIDIAGRLVGKQYLWLLDEGASDGGALLLAARKHGR